MKSTTIKPYRLRKEDYATHVYIDKGNKTILKLYKSTLKMTMTATLHFLIGLGARCFEEKHDQQIQDLEERVRIQAQIIVKYIEKYGQLRVKD
ncbi:hypothetical protein ACFLT4_07460 [Chloroflexota bacterium]